MGVPKTLRNITIVLNECNSSVKCILGYGNCAIVTMKHEHNKRKVKVGLCVDTRKWEEIFINGTIVTN